MDIEAKHDAVRRKILDVVLVNAAFDGWTEATLLASAKSAGISPEAARRAFPKGLRDLLDYHMREADRKMLAAMKSGSSRRLKLGERVALAIRARLEVAATHREATRRALAALSLPSNSGVAARGLFRTIDAIWVAVGDRATDFSYYTKRATLAAVYMATLLFWLDDESEGARDTWDFLGRRLDGVLRVGRLRRRAESALETLKTGAPFLARVLRRAA